MTIKRKKMLAEAIWHSLKYILTTIFIVLKLSGVINWNWVWVLCPLLVSIAAKLIGLIVLSLLMCVAPRIIEWIERWEDWR